MEAKQPVTPLSALQSAERSSSRKDRRRQWTQSHTPVIADSPEVTEPLAPTTTPEVTSPYGVEHEWAKEYATTHLDLLNPEQSPLYIAENEHSTVIDDDRLNLVDALVGLRNTRAALAEISVKLRNGSTLSTDASRINRLDKAEQAYLEARQIAADEFLATLPKNTKLARKQALMAEFSAREDGVLMGEEANYYLDRQQTLYQRSLEKYRGLSRNKKLIVGLTATAVIGAIGAVGGLVVGGAAAGGTIAARFGRGYIQREANRKENLTLLEKQKLSTLRTSGEADLFDLSRDLSKTRSAKTLTSRIFEHSEDGVTKHNREYMSEASAESSAKRKSFYWAIGGIAVGAVAGHLIDQLSDHITLPWDHSDLNDTAAGHENIDNAPTAQDRLQELQEEHKQLLKEQKALLEEKQALLEQHLAAEQAAQEAAAAAAHEQATALYGEFAGQTVSLDIPSGSNLWDQLELKVDQQNPFISFDEKQRLVGNMLAVLQEQNPGRDLNLVYAGEHFDISL